MPAINGFARSTNYDPALSMGTRPHPLVEHAAECADDEHLTALADSALMAAGLLVVGGLAAGVVGTVGLALVIKWLMESVK